MMVLLLYIQNQDKQKMTKKKIKSKSPKKNPNPATTQNNPKNPLTTTKKICHTPQFFFTSNEQDTRKKKK